MFHHVYFGGVDNHGAQFAGFGLAFGRKLDGVYSGGAGSAQGFDGEQADGAAAEYGGGVAGFQFALAHGIQGHGGGLGERALFVVDAVGQFVAQFAVYHAVAGEAAVGSQADEAEVFVEIVFAFEAVFGQNRLNGYAVAHFYVGYVRAHFHDFAGKFVAERERGFAAGIGVLFLYRDKDRAAEVFVQVAAADAGVFHSDFHLGGACDFGNGYVFHADVAAAVPSCSFHCTHISIL